jgi:hypothetical protein
MASFSGAMDVLVERLETHTPTEDPKAYYRHSRDGTPQPNRSFTVFPVSLTPLQSVSSDPVQAGITLKVFYQSETDLYGLLRRISDDVEDIHQRIAYHEGSEWAKISGYDFLINGTQINAESSYIVVEFDVVAIYNMRV